MEIGKRKELRKAFGEAQQLFICHICYAGLDPENNKPLISKLCTPIIKPCDECLSQLKYDQRNSQDKTCNLCQRPHIVNFENDYVQDFSFKQTLEQQLQSQKIAHKDICKNEMRIGFFPEKVIV